MSRCVGPLAFAGSIAAATAATDMATRMLRLICSPSGWFSLFSWNVGLHPDRAVAFSQGLDAALAASGAMAAAAVVGADAVALHVADQPKRRGPTGEGVVELTRRARVVGGWAVGGR